MIAPKTKRPHLFLDRDGVVIVDKHYVHREEDLELMPGILALLREAQRRQLRIVVVTNQSGIARGMFSLEKAHHFHHALNSRLIQHGLQGIEKFYICPHHPNGQIPELSIPCPCRKPKNGLLLQADADVPVDWSESLMIGDKDSDILCAQSLQVTSVLLNAGQYRTTVPADLLINRLDDPRLMKLLPDAR